MTKKNTKKGSPKTYEINGEHITVTPKFTGTKTASEYQRMARDFLEKINANRIEISTGYGTDKDSFAEASWYIDGDKYEKRVDIFDAQYANMGAIALYLRDWWRHVRRGLQHPVDSLEQFKALPGRNFSSMSTEKLRDLRKKYHPDTPLEGTDTEKFQLVQEELQSRRDD